MKRRSARDRPMKTTMLSAPKTASRSGPAPLWAGQPATGNGVTRLRAPSRSGPSGKAPYGLLELQPPAGGDVEVDQQVAMQRQEHQGCDPEELSQTDGRTDRRQGDLLAHEEAM